MFSMIVKLFPKEVGAVGVGGQQREFSLNTDAVHKMKKGGELEGKQAEGRKEEKKKKRERERKKADEQGRSQATDSWE